jgi:hypothetical protein
MECKAGVYNASRHLHAAGQAWAFEKVIIRQD